MKNLGPRLTDHMLDNTLPQVANITFDELAMATDTEEELKAWGKSLASKYNLPGLDEPQEILMAQEFFETCNRVMFTPMSGDPPAGDLDEFLDLFAKCSKDLAFALIPWIGKWTVWSLRGMTDTPEEREQFADMLQKAIGDDLIPMMPPGMEKAGIEWLLKMAYENFLK